MATYKVPKTVPTPVVGVKPAKEVMRETVVSNGFTDSQDFPATKTSGIKIRGTGAATKGTMARGPMA